MLGSVKSSLKSIYTYFSHKPGQKQPQHQFLIDRLKKRKLPDHFAQKLLDLEIAVTRDPHNCMLFKALMQLYAQGVEYYSSVGDDRYIALTERMQNFYQNPKISQALDICSSHAKHMSLQGGLSQRTHKLEEEEVYTPMGMMNYHFFDMTATTAVQSQSEDLKISDPSDQCESQFRFKEQISRLSITSFQQDPKQVQSEEQKQCPQNLMEGALVDFVAKRENIKIDLEKQTSIFNQRLLKRRLASASRSRNNSRTHYNQKSCPRKQKQSLCSQDLAIVTNFNYKEDSLSPRRELVENQHQFKANSSRELRLSSLFPQEMKEIESIGKIKETEQEEEEQFTPKDLGDSLEFHNHILSPNQSKKEYYFNFEEVENQDNNIKLEEGRKSRKSCFKGTPLQDILKKEEGLRKFEFVQKQFIPVRMERKKELKSKLLKRVPSLKGLIQTSTPQLSKVAVHSYNPTPRTTGFEKQKVKIDQDIVSAKLHRFAERSLRSSIESVELKPQSEARKPKHCFISLTQAVKRPLHK